MVQWGAVVPDPAWWGQQAWHGVVGEWSQTWSVRGIGAGPGAMVGSRAGPGAVEGGGLFLEW